MMQPASDLYHVAPEHAREDIARIGLHTAALLFADEYEPGVHHGDASHVWFTDAAREPSERMDVWVLAADHLPLYDFEHDPSDYPCQDGSTGEWFKVGFECAVSPQHLRLISSDQATGSCR
jgi:hypothetical protein